jgi:NADPH-dependent 2,4-dienoyl-CoA reductase/sulfur reductase-like enzyme
MAERNIVILGNGGAACHAVIAARNAGFSGEIHMISDISEPAFNPMLAPYYLKGRLPWQHCFPFGTDFYERYDVTRHFGSPVNELNTETRSVKTEDGLHLQWDQCLIATGANATIPPVPGLMESPFAYPLRTSASTRRLESIMTKAQKAVVMGASLVGIKIAEIMSHKPSRIVVVDVADQVMPRGAHPITAGYLQTYFEQHGVEFLLGCSLEGLEEKEDGVCCFFPESIVDDADFIGVCTGIRSNLGFIDPQQVDIDLGIVIDEQCRSSVDGLYAAGDCAQGVNPMSGQKEWQGTWVNACYQGRTAGLNMAGKSSRFEGVVPQHISPFFEWTYAQIGAINVEGESVRVETIGHPFKGDGKFKLLVYNEECLVGANLINCTESISSLKHAITLGLSWNEGISTSPAHLWKSAI